jgi:hypothetical protein
MQAYWVQMDPVRLVDEDYLIELKCNSYSISCILAHIIGKDRPSNVFSSGCVSTELLEVIILSKRSTRSDCQ